MLLSVALIFLLGLFSGWCCTRLRLPSLLGMLLVGVLLGPSVLNWLDPSLLAISAQLRRIALIIILMRAGLSLKLQDLRQVGRPAVLLCFVPACFELLGMVLLAPALLGITTLEAAILGTVVAAVSPAVVVPKMLRLMEEGLGTAHSIPQLILAGSAVDDVFVIVLFSAFTGMAQGETVSLAGFGIVPLSILLGAAVGAAAGWMLVALFHRVQIRATVQLLISLSLCFLLVTLEDAGLPLSGLIAVMSMGMMLQRSRDGAAAGLSAQYSRLWVAAEVLLFALVGASVDLEYALATGPAMVLLLLGALLFRIAGVLVCVLGSGLPARERLFCALAYLPKATVQAAIGGVPLAMGLPCGSTVLTGAVTAILLTAPVGALLIDLTSRPLLGAATAGRQHSPRH